MQIKNWIPLGACFIGMLIITLSVGFLIHKLQERTINSLTNDIVRIYKEDELRKKVLPKLNLELQEQIKKNKELVQQYTELLASYQTEVANGKGKPPVIIYGDPPKPGKDGKCPPLLKEVRWSYSDFRIEMEGEALSSQVKYKLNQLFKGQLVETKLPNGNYSYHVNIYELNRHTEEIVGSLKIDKLDVLKVDPLTSKFNFFNPNLDVMFGLGTNLSLSHNLTVDIGLSVMSYGKTNNDSKLRFLRFGVGVVNKDFSISFSPIQYNLGYDLPLISNLWITPFIGFAPIQKQEHFGLGISLKL